MQASSSNKRKYEKTIETETMEIDMMETKEDIELCSYIEKLFFGEFNSSELSIISKEEYNKFFFTGEMQPAKLRKIIDDRISNNCFVFLEDNAQKVFACTDLVKHISSFLPLHDIRNISLVCKPYSKILSYGKLYENITPSFFKCNYATQTKYLDKMVNYNINLFTQTKHMSVEYEEKTINVINQIYDRATKLESLHITTDDHIISNYVLKTNLEKIIFDNLSQRPSLQEFNIHCMQIELFKDFMFKHPEFKNTSIKTLCMNIEHEHIDDLKAEEIKLNQEDRLVYNVAKFINSFEKLENLELYYVSSKFIELLIPEINKQLNKLTIDIYDNFEFFNQSLRLIKQYQPKIKYLDLNVMPYLPNSIFNNFTDLEELYLGPSSYIMDNMVDEAYDEINSNANINNETILSLATCPKLKKVKIDGSMFPYNNLNDTTLIGNYSELLYEKQMINFDISSIKELLITSDIQEFIVDKNYNHKTNHVTMSELEDYIRELELDKKISIDIKLISRYYRNYITSCNPKCYDSRYYDSEEDEEGDEEDEENNDHMEVEN
jgi:hypothetical protein